MDGKDYRQERDAAASAGTCAHAMVEAHIRGLQFNSDDWPLDVFLKARLPCLISVRHPVSVINSWVLHARKKVDRGEALRGFANGEAIGFTSDRVSPVERRIDLHNYFVQLILAVKDSPGVKIVRYEDWFTNPAQLQDLCQFARIPSLGFLRPAPIPPSSIVLDSDEYDAILRGCPLMEELGYASRDGRLLPQDLEANIRSTGS